MIDPSGLISALEQIAFGKIVGGGSTADHLSVCRDIAKRALRTYRTDIEVERILALTDEEIVADAERGGEVIEFEAARLRAMFERLVAQTT